ncbi:MAG: PglZ domain-containing protein [Bdellovibrionales bacterium]|nr:PglZ domain-containing protein [Bdellovibrionales bacterium]
MNALYDHLSNTLSDKLTKGRVVTWYDPRREFSDFVAELMGGVVPSECSIDSFSLGQIRARLCVMQDSFFEVKFAVEPEVDRDLPDPLLIYVPGKVRNDETAVLMELEAGGERWEPQLKREGRRVLKKRFGDGQIDQMLESPNVTYNDIVGLLGDEGVSTRSGSLLELIYEGARGSNAALIAAWLASAAQDNSVIDKGADTELRQLLKSRLGLETEPDVPLDDIRRKTLRYVLLGEFRSDLQGTPPESLSLVVQPTNKHVELVLEVAQRLRDRYQEDYVRLADEIEKEFQLGSAGIAPDRLGRIDTFRFEEQSLLEFVGHLIVEGQFSKALEFITARRNSFWALHLMQRQEQWQAYGLAAELGIAITEISKQLPDSKKAAIEWVEGYVAEGGWYRADLRHRRLESTLSAMTDPIASEKVVHRVRNDYEKLTAKMTSGFVATLSQSNWTIPGVMHQSEIYASEVESPSETVCFVLVDALRYEMGVELKGLLEGANELSLQPAIGAIPTVTPVGMGALMPGADQSFSVVECGRDIGVKIEGSSLGNLNDRRRKWKGRVPDMVDLELDKVLSHSTSQLKKKIANAPFLLVRSLEIDAMGEGGNTFLARQVMDTAINNVARAVKRLAGLGISKFVIAADHGHLFIHERDESERIEKPGGEQVTLHRRCWVGRGGSNPPSTVRISGSELGYDSDLDFVFPTNNSVFKSGGDLSYYHGGLSLQELLIPVITARMKAVEHGKPEVISLKLLRVPDCIVNRIITFGIGWEAQIFGEDEIVVRPVLFSNGQHVGRLGMVLDAEHDTLMQTVKLRPGRSCTVGIQLLREDVKSVEIVVLDPRSDRILVKTDQIPVKLGI